jgi:hypothetical protein
MSRDRRKGRRRNARAFRPEIEGQRLEPRLVLSGAKTPFAISQYLLTHPKIGNAFAFNHPQHLTRHAHRYGGDVFDQGFVDVQTARGGQSVNVATPDGSRFKISLQYAENLIPPALGTETGGGVNVLPTGSTSLATGTQAFTQPRGTVRAYAMPGGKVGIIVDGSTMDMELAIDPLPFHQRKSYAHSFAYGEQGRSHVLNIGALTVTSGQIQAILGFHSADLSGPLSIGGTANVDRIAFDALQPGAVIGVGGTLNTLDIANNAALTSGPGISIGKDVNLLNVGGDLTLSNGTSLRIGRFAGVTPQPPKGTGTGSNILSLNQSQIGTGTAQLTPSISAYIQGNLFVGPGSMLSISSGIANSSILGTSTGSPTPFLVNGSLNLSTSIASQLKIPNLALFNAIVPGANFVARNGIIVNGVTVLPPA